MTSSDEFSHRADDLLRSLEPSFLEILAEHGPKVGGGIGAADSSTGGSLDGVTVDVIVRSNETIYLRYINALAHYLDHRCEESIGLLVELAEFVLTGIGSAGARKGWFTIEDEEF